MTSFDEDSAGMAGCFLYVAIMVILIIVAVISDGFALKR